MYLELEYVSRYFEVSENLEGNPEDNLWDESTRVKDFKTKSIRKIVRSVFVF